MSHPKKLAPTAWVDSHICIMPDCTAYCIRRVISPISSLNQLSSSLRLVCHVPMTRDQFDWDWRIWWKTTPHAIRCTEWRRYMGCLKLQVIFCTRATNYRALLREMTSKDKASYDSTPLCTDCTNDLSTTLGQNLITCFEIFSYGVATISRLLAIIGLFCRI